MSTIPTPSVRRNVVANLAGKLCAVAISLAFPPFFARYLGIESYGLIGVYASLTAVLGVLDLGMSSTFNREMARLSADDHDSSRQEMHDMVATFGALYWLVGIVAGAAIFFAAPLVSHWVHAQNLPRSTVVFAIRLMGLVFALQWPSGAYNGGLLGLQRHGVASLLQVVGSSLRNVVGALIIWKVARSIFAFFCWQAIVSFAQTLATMWALRACLPGSNAKGRPTWAVLVRSWRFSAGMAVISLLTIALTQTDNIVVSALLPLEKFGYYTLAWTVGNALMVLVSPIFVAVFPRLSQLVKQGLDGEIAALYHISSQLAAALLFPAAVVLVLFPREVLFAWSGDAVLTEATYRIVVVVAIGSALNALMNVPYVLQLAHGWTSLVIRANIVAVVIVVPMVIVLTRLYGTVGAAISWAVLNAAYVLLVIRLMHRRLLPRSMWRWYSQDVALPLAGALAAVIPLRMALPVYAGRLAALAAALSAGVLAAIGAFLASPILRRRGFTLLSAALRVRGA